MLSDVVLKAVFGVPLTASAPLAMPELKVEAPYTQKHLWML